MAVFKDAGVVVTTPSSGTYVIECIGNVGVLADMIGARVREVGGDDAVRRVEEAFRLGSAEGTSSRPARGAKGSAAARAASKTKREPSKTKAAVAAAKRRARIKAEKLAAEEEAKRSSREALLRASRARASPGTSYDPAEGPLATRRDRALDVEEDVAEAAEAMRGMIPAAPPSGLGLPPDADAAPASDGEEVFETREDDRSEERERSGGEGTKPEPERTAASLFEARLRERFPRGAAFAFDRKEAAVCEMRGWDRVAACRVRRVSADGVHVACRTAETDGAFVGAFRVPPRAATRVLVHRAPSPEALGRRGEEKTPPAFPSGSAERRRAVASAETAAAALAAARREGPGAFAPGSWVLERRAAAEAAAAAASRLKPPRGADAREPSAPPERAAGLAMPSLARDVALLAREVASFRRETTEGLASACASLERVVESIRELRRGEAKKENRARDRDARRGGEVADARAREEEEEEEEVPVAAGAPAAAPEDPSPFERSAFVAEARALASLGEERKSAKKTASSGGARGGGAATASEGAEKKGEATRRETRPFSPKGDGERASPNLSRSTSQVVPETPAAETVAGIEGSGAGGERFQTPRGGVEADASDGGAADADMPEDPGVLLEPSARICTDCHLHGVPECRCRFQTQRELIDHMLETHGVEARAREEVDGPVGDLAGMHPFAGS